jgi:hypothetical protein
MSQFNMSNNPYQTPVNQSPLSNSELDSGVRDMMRSMGAWQFFMAILGFIVSGITLLVFVAQLLFGARAGGPQAIAALVGLVTVGALVILFYVIPAYLLFKAARKLSEFSRTGEGSTREIIQTQHAFWRYVGIAVAIILVIYAGILLFALVFAGFAFR